MGKTSLTGRIGGVFAGMGGAAALLAGCASMEPGPGAGACGTEQFAYLIGQSEAEARAANLPPLHRVYTEGDPITMDMRPDRLNVILDDSGTVVGLECG